jgi:hypothetical protein
MYVSTKVFLHLLGDAIVRHRHTMPANVVLQVSTLSLTLLVLETTRNIYKSPRHPH